jgi:tetratricopeptide (TPR) repeat protein
MAPSRKMILAALLSLPTLLSCQPQPTLLQIRELADLSLQTPVAIVEVSLPVVEGSIPREPERLGLITLLLEAGLADIDGVVPRVNGQPPSPGLRGALQVDAEHWQVLSRVSGSGETLSVRLTLCDPEAVCTEDVESLSAIAPHAGMASLLERAAAVMDRPLRPEVRQDIARRPSQDDYALLLAGRAAATFYGTLPPAEVVGDRRRDPITRAAFVDPKMADVWWLIARRATELGDHEAAAEALTRGRDGSPRRLALQADQAENRLALGLKGAAVAWEGLDRSDDRRFSIPRARGLLADGRIEEARQISRRLAALSPDDPDVIILMVKIADVRGGAGDALLSRWQEAAPTDPEPVRRRIQLALSGSRLVEARDLLPALRSRLADPTEADRLLLTLDAALGELEGAAVAADRLGLPDAAVQLRARASLKADPTARPPLPGVVPEVAAVVTGRALLAAGDAAGAEAAAGSALKLRPHWPEALALVVDSRAAAGLPVEAARAALYSADPDWGGPSTAAGSSGSGAQSQPVAP